MKRSQAIEEIVYMCLSWDGLDTCGVPAREIADDILKCCEKMGMLPPEWIQIVEPYKDEIRYSDIQHHINRGNKWEPEDEKTNI